MFGYIVIRGEQISARVSLDVKPIALLSKPIFLLHDKLCIGRISIDTTPFFLQNFENCWIRCAFTAALSGFHEKAALTARAVSRIPFHRKDGKGWEIRSDLPFLISCTIKVFLSFFILHFFTIVILL